MSGSGGSGLHIGFICSEYPPARHGGIGSFVQTLARALVRRGHEVTAVGLYAPGETCESLDEGVRVVRVGGSRVPNLRILTNPLRLQTRLEAIHAQRPFDVIEGSERSFFLLRKSFPVSKIIRMHGGHCYFRVTLGDQPSWLLRRQELHSFSVADHVCAVSQFVGETTRQLLNLGPIPIRVILNPVDLSVFRPQPEIPPEDGLLTYVGTVIAKKGIRQLVDAMPRIIAGYPSARLVVYGNDTTDPGTGGSYIAALLKRVPPKLRDRVTFAGAVSRDRLPGLLAQASVCVYPSHMEALPIAWVEGLAMGKAVVASQTGPGPEVLEHGVSGLLCDPYQPDSIAVAVLELLCDPALRRRMGAAARERAANLFCLDKLIDQNISYYRSCSGTRG